MAQRAGTIMHELGHNLGLHHGGVDDENYKPNHLSIMSYANQFNWLIKDGKPYLDYERFNLRNLNEKALDERAGLSVRSGTETLLARYGVRWFTNGVGRVKKTGADKLVDWNHNGNAGQASVSVDINAGDAGPANKTTLRAGFVEWQHIIFNGGQIGASGGRVVGPMAVAPNALKELSLEEHLKMTKKTIEVK
jgi:hypothetical protein